MAGLALALVAGHQRGDHCLGRPHRPPHQGTTPPHDHIITLCIFPNIDPHICITPITGPCSYTTFYLPPTALLHILSPLTSPPHFSPQGGSITSAKSITTDTLEVTHKAVFGGQGKEGTGAGAGAGATFTGPAVFQGNVEVSTLFSHVSY